jgi:hypothetical protein
MRRGVTHSSRRVQPKTLAFEGESNSRTGTRERFSLDKQIPRGEKRRCGAKTKNPTRVNPKKKLENSLFIVLDYITQDLISDFNNIYSARNLNCNY